MPSTRRVVSGDPDVRRRLDARRPVVGVVVAEARAQRGARHDEGHEQGDGELHPVGEDVVQFDFGVVRVRD